MHTTFPYFFLLLQSDSRDCCCKLLFNFFSIAGLIQFFHEITSTCTFDHDFVVIFFIIVVILSFLQVFSALALMCSLSYAEPFCICCALLVVSYDREHNWTQNIVNFYPEHKNNIKLMMIIKKKPTKIAQLAVSRSRVKSRQSSCSSEV